MSKRFLIPVLFLPLVAAGGEPAATFLPLDAEVSGAHAHPMRPDGHAPIGVMGDHMHKKGEWMFSYRYMRMEMDGMRDGTSSLSPAEVLAQGFMVTPTEMTMDMHMLGAMYGVTDDVTAMVMLPWVSRSMDHVTGMGGTFTTESDGIGDVQAGALVRLMEGEGQHLHLNAMVSVPTGSIDERDVTPASMGNPVILPYPMQNGSGTWDLLPGVTWTASGERWSGGAQAIVTLRLGENDRDYTLGDRFDVTAWIARRLGQNVSCSLRLDGETVGRIDGADPALNPAMVPTADPDHFGGERLDLLGGVNVTLGRGNRLALEAGAPVFQDLNGPQMETDLVATLGWQLSL